MDDRYLNECIAKLQRNVSKEADAAENVLSYPPLQYLSSYEVPHTASFAKLPSGNDDKDVEIEDPYLNECIAKLHRDVFKEIEAKAKPVVKGSETALPDLESESKGESNYIYPKLDLSALVVDVMPSAPFETLPRGGTGSYKSFDYPESKGLLAPVNPPMVDVRFESNNPSDETETLVGETEAPCYLICERRPFIFVCSSRDTNNDTPLGAVVSTEVFENATIIARWDTEAGAKEKAQTYANIVVSF